MDNITPRPRDFWIAGQAERSNRTFAVTHPYDGTEVATVAVPEDSHVKRAIAAAEGVARELRSVPAHERTSALERVARGLSSRADETAEMITAESGKPLHWAEIEVTEAIATLRAAARLAGEMRRVECDLAGENRASLIHRVPSGPVWSAIPHHAPLSLTARTFAVTVAVGAPVIVTPPVCSPMSALGLGELLANTDLPQGTFSVLPIDDVDTLVHDPRLLSMPHHSFHHVTAVVLADWPDLDHAAARIATTGTGQAGQSCVAVRHVVVESGIATEFVPKLTEAVRAQHSGDPYDTEVSVGPMIDQTTAEKTESWIEDLVADGAKLLTGGIRNGTVVEPTLLTDIPAGAEADQSSLPGPVLTVSVVDSAEEAFAASTGYRTGVFTRDVELVLSSSSNLDSDEVVIGDVPFYRPEGVRATMRALTEERLIMLPGSVT